VGSRARLIGAWVLLVGSVILWPLSAITWAKEEPQTVLGLSFLAITFTALDILSTVTVRNKQEDEN
jgi:hypothetical protein